MAASYECGTPSQGRTRASGLAYEMQPGQLAEAATIMDGLVGASNFATGLEVTIRHSLPLSTAKSSATRPAAPSGSTQLSPGAAKMLLAS